MHADYRAKRCFHDRKSMQTFDYSNVPLHDDAEQDKGLEVLSHVISRQKHLAYNIADEVDVQNGEHA